MILIRNNTIWLPVPGFEHRYSVSDDGQVMNWKRHRVLKPKSAGRGYAQVCLGAGNYRYIHRLVAQAFLPETPGMAQVNHIDGDKRNNRIGNLEWCTAKGNSRHAYNTGLLSNTACCRPINGGGHARSRAVLRLNKDGSVRHRFPSISAAATACSINKVTLNGYLHGRSNPAKSKEWRFEAQGN